MISTPLDLAADPDTAGQEALFEKVSAEFAAPLTRLARAHEADAHQQQDLLQEIHIALWRSLAAFGGRCSLRTWVYRVAHNVVASHVMRNYRATESGLRLCVLSIAGGQAGERNERCRCSGIRSTLLEALELYPRTASELFLQPLPD